MQMKKFNLKLSDLLKNGEDEASLVVRLMMACNDIMLANRCMGYFKSNKEPINEHLKVGACRYFLKIQCSHLVEALGLIYELNKIKLKNNRIQETYDTCSDESKKDFNELISHIKDRKQRSDKFQKIVKILRNKVGFHYDNKMFKEAIKTRANNSIGNDVTLNYSDDIRLRRYNLADDIHDTLVCRQIWKFPSSLSNDELSKKADENADFAFELCIKFVDFSDEFIDTYLKKFVGSYQRADK